MGLDQQKTWNIGGARVVVERTNDGLASATVLPCVTMSQSERVIAFVARQIEENFKGHTTEIDRTTINVKTDNDQVISGERAPSYVDAVFRDIQKNYSSLSDLPKGVKSRQEGYADIANKAAATDGITTAKKGAAR